MSSSYLVCFEYTPAQDFFNWTTHAAGAVCAAAFTFVDAFLMARSGMSLFAHLAFDLGTFAMFTASALYHAARNVSSRRFLKIIDHCAIYSAIAGMGVLLAYEYSYRLGDAGRFYAVASVMCGSALAGWIFKIFTAGRFKIFSTALYLMLGWGAAVAAFPAFSGETSNLGWLAAGGVVYTAGTTFYVIKRVGWTHCVWHLFVLVGAACHMCFAFGLH